MARKDHMLHESLHEKPGKTGSTGDADPVLPIMLKMLAITIYALCVLWFFFDGREWQTVADMEWTTDATIAAVLGGVLWVALAGYFVHGFVRCDNRLSYLRTHLGILMLLASVVFTYFIWLPALALALIVVGFILELPRHSSGHELTTALSLIVFVSAIVTIGLVRVESAAAESRLSTISHGLSWTVARLLGPNTSRSALKSMTSSKSSRSLLTAATSRRFSPCARCSSPHSSSGPSCRG